MFRTDPRQTRQHLERPLAGFGEIVCAARVHLVLACVVLAGCHSTPHASPFRACGDSCSAGAAAVVSEATQSNDGLCRDRAGCDRDYDDYSVRTASPSTTGSLGMQRVSAIQQASWNGNPRELSKTTLPRYVIEPPDILLIEAVNTLRVPETPLRPGETLIVRVANSIPVDPLEGDVTRQFKVINGPYAIQTDGTIDFGPEYGQVFVAGMSITGARYQIEQHLKQTLVEPQVYVNVAAEQARQHIAGEHLVRPDGTVSLGVYGSVYLAGMTIEEARSTLERHLSRSIYQPEIHIDVLAYNSKIYYVVTDGGGAGEQVFRFACTGNETVLDALSQINGLPSVASKKHIWIARPAPPELGHDQILDVDWDGIVRRGQTQTNFQVLPGDRIYVQADRMVRVDTFVAKFISPFERIFGWTILGNGMVRTLQRGSTTGGF